MAKEKKLRAARASIHLLKDLMTGKPHDRYSAAKLLGLRPPGASDHLDLLEELFPKNIVVHEDEGKRVYTFHKTKGAPDLADAEVVAACLGASLAPIFQSTSYAKAMATSRTFVTKAARKEERFRHADRKFAFVVRGGEMALDDGDGHLDEIVDALLRENLVKVKYSEFGGEQAEQVLEPWSLLVYEHQLYLLGRTVSEVGAATNAKRRVHPIRVARIQELERLDEHFTYPSPATYSPAQVFRNSWGIFLDESNPVEEVTVRLAPLWKHYVESHRWHASQASAVQDGKTTIRFTVRVCPEFKAWVRSFGEQIEVIRPRELAREFARERELSRTTRRPRGKPTRE